MKKEEGFAILHLPYSFMGGQGMIHPFLVWDKESTVLIDAGFPGQAPQINELLEMHGIHIEELSHVILTHHDLDHIGSLSTLKTMSGNTLKTASHHLERPYIEMEKLPLKITPERIRQIEKNMTGSLQDSLNGLKTKVDILLNDEDELALCGGLKIISTPGHTEGHISIYLKKYKTLIAGDALNFRNGMLLGPDPNYTYDMQEAIKSLEKLLNYDIQSVLCYHGGMYQGNVEESIEKLITNR